MREEETYLPRQEIGQVVRGVGVGSVVESRHADLPTGTTVMALLGWQEFGLVDGKEPFFLRLPDESQVPAVMQLALFGPVGVAAYFGLTDVARPCGGETLVVSAAGSAVGSLVGQIGKLLGCRVIGITGSDEKCRWLTHDVKRDAAINYRTGPVFKRLCETCPEGIDVFFDNVGGSMLEDALNLLKPQARVVACGMMSAYNDCGGALMLPAGPNNLINLVFKRARIEGLVCLNYWHRALEAFDAIGKWHTQGAIKYRVQVVEGLRNAPRLLNTLFEGSNRGKLVLQL